MQNMLIGYLLYYENYSHPQLWPLSSTYISMIWIDPQFKNKNVRKTIAAKFMSEIEKTNNRAYTRIISRNKRSIDFFKKNNFYVRYLCLTAQ